MKIGFFETAIVGADVLWCNQPLATGLTTSHIQDSKAFKKPTKLPTFNHKCE